MGGELELASGLSETGKAEGERSKGGGQNCVKQRVVDWTERIRIVWLLTSVFLWSSYTSCLAN